MGAGEILGALHPFQFGFLLILQRGARHDIPNAGEQGLPSEQLSDSEQVKDTAD
jgi:hypothetical protein